MKIDVLTIFPDYFEPLKLSLLGKAQVDGLVQISIHNLRDYANDIHRSVDDTPYGGGPGMVMKVEVLQKAIDAVLNSSGFSGYNIEQIEMKERLSEPIFPSAEIPVEESISPSSPNTIAKNSLTEYCLEKKALKIILTSAAGELFNQSMAAAFRAYDQLIIVCGRFEGFDQRIVDYYERKGVSIAELSIGNFVTFGGEAPALSIIESVVRLIPGVLGNHESLRNESFHSVVDGEDSWVEHPQYTKPADFEGLQVPAVLLNGNHAEIQKYRTEQARIKTQKNRPDLI
ncbi:MAG: tRNA (guanosine(37)-N1)-methyltransferase TrmD [Bifidobacteriaceae bacterium]|jgi:tRNA (guanine37-N1)-methyltransferase|nr:tRNA (guanosine(37)-N1)-methyltransferase TrmD [Bifidobacteriaceae bacterium]